MVFYLLAFAWGIVILLSLIGWGGIVRRIIRESSQVDWGEQAAWGMAFSVVFGGILNATWSISKLTILIYIVGGFLSFLFDLYQNRILIKKSIISSLKDYQSNRLLLLCSAVALILGLLQYAGWVSTTEFHDVDDYLAYLVLPNKMLQMGALGEDPFSRRRIESSLGGQSFLHTLILCLLSEENIHLLDPGIALIIVWGITLSIINRKNLPQSYALLIIFPLLFVIPPSRNATSIITASSLFLSFFNLLDSQKLKPNHLFGNSFIIALHVAAIFALKYTFVPAITLFLLSSYSIYIFQFQDKKSTIYEFIFTSFLILLFLLPWMLSLYQSSGTFLYPILGKGYHASVYYNHYIPRNSDVFTERGLKLFFRGFLEIFHVAFFLISLAYLSLKPWRLSPIQKRGSTLAFFLSTWVSILIILLLGEQSERYTFPLTYAAIIVCLIEILTVFNNANNNKSASKPAIPILIAMLVAGLIIGSGNGWLGVREYYQKQVNNAYRGLTNPPSLATRQEVKQYTEMQQSIPENEVILTGLNKPFLLDFSRHKLFITDGPGYASLPPGMPLFKGSEALSKYLIAKNIRYIAFDYATPPGTDRQYWIDKLGLEIYPWTKQNKILSVRPSLRNEVQYTLDFNENLKQLGTSRKKIYDDGEIFVIDLLKQATPGS